MKDMMFSDRVTTVHNYTRNSEYIESTCACVNGWSYMTVDYASTADDELDYDVFIQINWSTIIDDFKNDTSALNAMIKMIEIHLSNFEDVFITDKYETFSLFERLVSNLAFVIIDDYMPRHYKFNHWIFGEITVDIC